MLGRDVRHATLPYVLAYEQFEVSVSRTQAGNHYVGSHLLITVRVITEYLYCATKEYGFQISAGFAPVTSYFVAFDLRSHASWGECSTFVEKSNENMGNLVKEHVREIENECAELLVFVIVTIPFWYCPGRC